MTSSKLKCRDNIGILPEGLVEIFVYHHGVLVEVQEYKNIILYQGRAEMIRTISRTNPSLYPRVINRMAIGDRGTIPADSQVPKVPTADMDALYNEIYREDIEAKNETTVDEINKCEFISEFKASEIPLSAFSNPATPRINEVGLVFIDPGAAAGVDRSANPVIAPDSPPPDEVLASIRTFKSIPFEAANDVSVTIRYTLFVA